MDGRAESVAEIVGWDEHADGSPFRDNWTVIDTMIERMGLDEQRERIALAYRLLCTESLRHAPRPDDPRASVISHTRVPLEYSFTTLETGGALRLLAEAAPASWPLPRRFEEGLAAIDDLRRALGLTADPDPLHALMAELFPENLGALDQFWHNGALWISLRFAPGAHPILRVYANQQINNDEYRNKKLRRALDVLGFAEHLPLLSRLAPVLEPWTTVSGISFDIYPGRITSPKLFYGANPGTLIEPHVMALAGELGLGHDAKAAIAAYLGRLGLCDRTFAGPCVLCSIGLPRRAGGALSLKLDATAKVVFRSDKEAYDVADSLFNGFRLHPDSLRAAEDLFFSRRLNHELVETIQYVGLQVATDGKLGVNVYLSPGQTRGGRMGQRARAPVDREPTKAVLEDAIERAVHYLLEQQSPGGGFWDLAVSVGSSGPWLTGVVGEALHHVVQLADTASVERALGRAVTYLRRNELPGGGWGYNEALSEDCDSTGHAIRLLRLCDVQPSPRAVAMLEAFQNDAGAFLTYRNAPPMHSWGTVHHDVHPIGVQALALLRGSGDPDVRSGAQVTLDAAGERPCWPAFWWATTSYGAYVSLSCLAELGALDRLSDATAEALARQQSASTPLEAALSVLNARIWRHRRLEAGGASALCALLTEQRSDGSWPGSHALRVVKDNCPRPWLAESDDIAGPRYPESKRLFTTALACKALALALPEAP